MATTEPLCGNCGYNVRGLTTFICPECGQDLRDVGIVRVSDVDARFPLWIKLVTFVVIWFLCGTLVGRALEQNRFSQDILKIWIAVWSALMVVGILMVILMHRRRGPQR